MNAIIRTCGSESDDVVLCTKHCLAKSSGSFLSLHYIHFSIPVESVQLSIYLLYERFVHFN